MLLPFVSSSLLLPAGRSVRVSESSNVARSSASRTHNSFPNGPARPVALNAGSATQVWLASPKVATRAGKVEALLEASPEAEIASPLEDAISMGNEELVKALLEAGASLEATSAFSLTPLKHAIRCGNVDVIKVLLEAGASVEAVESEYAPTPLQSAIYGIGNVEVVKILLEAGASLEAGPNFLRPMDAAISERNVEVVETLIDAGAPLDRQDWRVARFAVFTPLEYAIINLFKGNGDLNVIKVLLYASLTANPARSALWLAFWLAYLNHFAAHPSPIGAKVALGIIVFGGPGLPAVRARWAYLGRP